MELRNLEVMPAASRVQRHERKQSPDILQFRNTHELLTNAYYVHNHCTQKGKDCFTKATPTSKTF